MIELVVVIALGFPIFLGAVVFWTCLIVALVDAIKERWGKQRRPTRSV